MPRPKFRRSYLKMLNKELQNNRRPEIHSENNGSLYGSKPPRQEQGCCYKGKVIDFSKGDPVILYSYNRPVIFLKKYGNEDFQVGDMVAYEFTGFQGNHGFGDFIGLVK